MYDRTIAIQLHSVERGEDLEEGALKWSKAERVKYVAPVGLLASVSACRSLPGRSE